MELEWKVMPRLAVALRVAAGPWLLPHCCHKPLTLLVSKIKADSFIRHGAVEECAMNNMRMLPTHKLNLCRSPFEI
jgi:hypothetical protein